MGTEITGPNDLTDRIKEKIKATFVDLIPEDQWETLIKSAINNYTAPKDNPHGPNKQSELEKDVHDMLRDDLKKKVKERIQTLSNNWWDGQGTAELNGELQKILEKAAPGMLTNIMSNVAAQVIQSMSNGVSAY